MTLAPYSVPVVGALVDTITIALREAAIALAVELEVKDAAGMLDDRQRDMRDFLTGRVGTIADARAEMQAMVRVNMVLVEEAFRTFRADGPLRSYLDTPPNPTGLASP